MSEPELPEWLTAVVADPAVLLAALSEHAARFEPPLLSKRLVDALIRFDQTASAGLDSSERLKRVYAGDREVADYFVHFMQRFGAAIDAIGSLWPVIRERDDGQRERLLSALLLTCEATLGTTNVDCADHVVAVARGELSLDDALRAVALAKEARARAIAKAAAPREAPGVWTVDDATRALTMPVWPRFERDGADTEEMSELEKRLYRRSVESKWRMEVADRGLVLAFYREWGAREGWPVTAEKELGLDVVEIKPERAIGEHGVAFTVWVGADFATLGMHWIAPSEIELKIAEIAEMKRKLGW